MKALNNLINNIYLVYGYPEIIIICVKIEKLEMVCEYNNNKYDSIKLIDF